MLAKPKAPAAVAEAESAQLAQAAIATPLPSPAAAPTVSEAGDYTADDGVHAAAGTSEQHAAGQSAAGISEQHAAGQDEPELITSRLNLVM